MRVFGAGARRVRGGSADEIARKDRQRATDRVKHDFNRVEHDINAFGPRKVIDSLSLAVEPDTVASGSPVLRSQHCFGVRVDYTHVAAVPNKVAPNTTRKTIRSCLSNLVRCRIAIGIQVRMQSIPIPIPAHAGHH